MLTHIIILYVACAGLILWQYLSLKQEEKVIEELKFLSARIHYLEQKGTKPWTRKSPYALSKTAKADTP